MTDPAPLTLAQWRLLTALVVRAPATYRVPTTDAATRAALCNALAELHALGLVQPRGFRSQAWGITPRGRDRHDAEVMRRGQEAAE